jgi:hypothetical protein
VPFPQGSGFFALLKKLRQKKDRNLIKIRRRSLILTQFYFPIDESFQTSLTQDEIIVG